MGLLFVPAIIFGIFFFVFSQIAKKQRAQANANRQANEAAGGDARPPQTPVMQRPAPQARPNPAPARPQPNVSAPKTAPRPNPNVNRPAQKAPQQMHPEHDLCALRADGTDAQTAVQSAVRVLPNLTQDNIVKGVVFSEILGKPKALR